MAHTVRLVLCGELTQILIPTQFLLYTSDLDVNQCMKLRRRISGNYKHKNKIQLKLYLIGAKFLSTQICLNQNTHRSFALELLYQLHTFR